MINLIDFLLQIPKWFMNLMEILSFSYIVVQISLGLIKKNNLSFKSF